MQPTEEFKSNHPIGAIALVECLDDIEHERDKDTSEPSGELRTDLIGKVVELKSYWGDKGICLEPSDMIIECVVVGSGEEVGFYSENLLVIKNLARCQSQRFTPHIQGSCGRQILCRAIR
jgi:hypothetical protein